MHSSYESKCVRPDELDALNQDNVISGGRRTRGIRVDYTKVAVDPEGQHDDSESETETKVPKNRKEAVQKPRTRSPERKKVTNVEKELGEGGEEEEGGEDDGELNAEDEELDDEDEDDDDDDDDE